MSTSTRTKESQTTQNPIGKALVRACSTYAEGWEWNFHYEEEPGIFRAFVKSPYCPEGEYGLVDPTELKDIPWLSLSTHHNVCRDFSLMPTSLKLLNRIDKCMRDGK